MPTSHDKKMKQWFDAARGNGGKSMRELAGAGCSLEWTGQHNRTALLIAARAGKHGAMQALVELGANVRVVDIYNENLLHAAAESSSMACLKLALEQIPHGVNIEQLGKDHRTPLEFELQNRQDAARVQLLLDAGANPNGRYNRPMAIAAARNCPAIMDILHRAGAELHHTFDADEMDSWKFTAALHDAAGMGADKSVAWLLEKGVPVDVVNSDGDTPLLLACKRATSFHETTVELLLGAGANPLHRNLANEMASDAIAVRRPSSGAVWAMLQSQAQALEMQRDTPDAGRRGVRVRL